MPWRGSAKAKLAKEYAPGFEGQCEKLLDDLQRLVDEKRENEGRWSKVSSFAIIVLVAVLTVATIISIFVFAETPSISALIAGTAGVVTTASHALPYDRKRLGNKILLAKACDLCERVEDLKSGRWPAGTSDQARYEALVALRFEKNVLRATSSTQAALRPFRELMDSSGGSEDD